MTAKRFFEIIPGALAWLTFIAMVLAAWLIPSWTAIFIIFFDTYWLLKTIYLSFHLRATFVEMQRVVKVDWLEKVKELTEPRNTADMEAEPRARRSWSEIYHLVILPMYNEPYAVVRESFESLAKIHYPKEKLLVVLALEEGGGDEVQRTGKRIQEEFGTTFGKFMITTHPKGLPDEIPGKGSNESWAGARAKEEIVDAMGIPYKDILVSVFDIDTQVFPEYFGRLTYVFLSVKNPLKAIHLPSPFLTQNLFEAPALARVVAFSITFWQMMQQARPERLTSFSSQSIPFQTLVDIGFWGRDIVSEDSRVFWQGYLAYHGDFRVEPLFYPISMDANVAPTFWGTMMNIYKQQRRWAWGCENIPYMLEGFRNDPKIPGKKKRYWTFNSIEGFHSWATNSLMIFALGWLPIFLGGKTFGQSLLSYSLPNITRWIVSLSMLGIASSAVLSIILLPKKPGGMKKGDYFMYFIQWALMPISLIVFGAFPAIEAETRLMIGGRSKLGFWVTPKSRKPADDPSGTPGISDGTAHAIIKE